MESVDINYGAVIAAMVVSMIIGSLWYSKIMFGKVWMKLAGLKENEMGSGNFGYLVTAVLSLVQAWILAHFVQYAGSGTFAEGAITGFWLWLGFMAITSAVNFVFEGRPWKLWKINAGYFLVVLAINGGLLAVWT